MGPGSKRGMNRLHDRPPETHLSQKKFLMELKSLWYRLRDSVPAIMDRLEIMDIQNCLCEIFKYEKALFGMGRPKQRYDGVKDDVYTLRHRA